MRFETHIPAPPLSSLVAMMWHCEGYAAPHAMERVLPDGTAQLLIHLKDEPLRAYDPRDVGRHETFRGPLVSGARSMFAVIDGASQGSLMGVQFKAGGAFSVLGFPAGELHNAYASLEAAWGTRAVDLHHQLLEATTAAARFRILETLLRRQHRAMSPPHRAVQQALAAFDAAPHDQSIGRVCEDVGLSARRFIQVFREHVGMTPKLYCRLLRFQAGLALIGRQAQPDLAQVALGCGYFDQSHFNRDFRDFAGVSPTAYLKQRGDHPNHLELSA